MILLVGINVKIKFFIKRGRLIIAEHHLLPFLMQYVLTSNHYLLFSICEEIYVLQLHPKIALQICSYIDKILQKVGEESIETILAAKDSKMSGQTDALVHETADLWFHTMVMLSHLGTDTKAVLDELNRRFGVSGFEEKSQRQNN